MYLQVPERYRPGIQKLISVKEDVINALVLALQALPPTLEPVSDITEKASTSGKVDRTDAFDIANLIVSLYALREDEDASLEEIVDAVVEGLSDDAQYSEISQKDLTRFRDRLTTLLKTNPALTISRKASSLVGEYERLYSDSKIVTDVRPVFDSESESEVEAAIVVHTMKILYQDMQGPKEFFVAISSEDLEDLYAQIFIAIENRKAIKSMLRKAQISCITSSSLFDEKRRDETQ